MVSQRCRADGDGWACDKTRKYRHYCTAHQRQVRAGKGLRPIRKWTSVAERRRGETYLCVTCGQYKSMDRFGMCSTGPRPDCTPCSSAKVRAKRYGLSPAQVADMLARQQGKCLICGISQDDASQVFAVDHDHACCSDSSYTCGKCVRGILCRTCNSGLGYFRDSPDLLQKAITYLASVPASQEADNP